MFDAYVGVDTTPLYKKSTGNDAIIDLLWGDGVKVLRDGPPRKKVKARGLTGYVDADAVEGTSLLEIYVIDVGQGDGILIKTPDFRHLLIDGGYPRAEQPTEKSAADFVDWKFHKDYGMTVIELDAMIASHIDADHYGGLWDLLDVSQNDELDCEDVRVKAFYHGGLAWWKKNSGGGKTLGTPVEFQNAKYFTQLMEDRNQVEAALVPGATPELQGWWRDFMQTVVNARWTDNQPTKIERLSHLSGTVPGFSGANPGEPAFRVLAPHEFDIDGKAGIRRFTGGDAQNTNGNSLVLRLDYGRFRCLLTGDLNKKSQKALLEDLTGRRQDLLCDVAKSCHHGSEDVSYEFLQAVRPAVTVISSGDNEGHDHPRPNIVSASALTGHVVIEDDELILPLVYSTELARSVSFGDPFQFDERDPSGNTVNSLTGAAFERSTVRFTERKAGDLQPKTKTKKLGNTLVVAGIIYGLVNVRTDGDKILCAVMNEKDHSWQIKTLLSRF